LEKRARGRCDNSDPRFPNFRVPEPENPTWIWVSHRVGEVNLRQPPVATLSSLINGDGGAAPSRSNPPSAFHRPIWFIGTGPAEKSLSRCGPTNCSRIN